VKQVTQIEWDYNQRSLLLERGLFPGPGEEAKIPLLAKPARSVGHRDLDRTTGESKPHSVSRTAITVERPRVEKNFGRQRAEEKGEKISTGGECSVNLD